MIDILRAGQSRRLTVIHGPTGFGKSTLASQWCELLTAEGVAVAWLTVDHDDNNVVWFLAHLVEAIRAVTPALAAELWEVLEEHGDESERYVLTSLVNEVHQSGTRMMLVIDDWHLVTNKATIAALRYLLDNLCSGLTLLVTSRSQRGLPMSRMRVRDDLVEIDSTALRFDVDESEIFWSALAGWTWTTAMSRISPPRPTAGLRAAVGSLSLREEDRCAHRRHRSAPRDQRVPRRQRTGHPRTVDARLPARHFDHRANLR